jgi:nucleoside 2-deoxyribosyltransferase
MPRCFVIQPFDDGERYDKRYKDVFAPAIEAADLEPYRVDRDPNVTIPIEDIERGIGDSEVCLAEISTDNPNVWYELGYAIASGRDVVLLCSDERRSSFPFDVQHRKIIKYSTQSTSDFEAARSNITTRLNAVLRKRQSLGQMASVTSVSRVEGLEQYEIAGLVAVAEEVDDPESGVSAYSFRKNMEQAGFTRLAGSLALGSLVNKEMLERFEDHDYDGSPFTAFRVTAKGMAWLVANKEKLTLQFNEEEPKGITDDDIPF